MVTGLFIGRFQPFHKGHLYDIKLALKDVNHLIIAIGSSQYDNEKENPFTYEERKKMIEEVLEANHIHNGTILPLPDYHDDAKWLKYIEKEIPEFEYVYSGNQWVLSLFQNNKKFDVKKLKLIDDISSTSIRDLVKHSKQWEHLVPKEVVDYIKKINGIERIKSL